MVDTSSPKGQVSTNSDQLQSHYLFRDRFGRPGNDKGKVEAPVRMGTPIWYSRQSRWTSPCKSDTIVELRVFAEVNDAV